MERITLNLIPKGITPICHASQYDTGRQIALDLMDDLQGYTLSDETIELGVCKPDGNIVTAAVEVTSGKTYVIIETTEQMTACEGDSECELKISKDGTVIGTLNFKLRVERDPLKDGIESETFIHNLEEQIAESVAEQYDSQNVIFDDHPTAGHGTGYTVTSESIKTYGDGIIALIPVKLSDLSDVNINNPQANQALIFDLTDPDNPVIKNGTVSTVGNLDDLNDVDTTGKQEGDSLRYIGGEWKAKPTTVKMTQAEYDLIVDFTPYENTHIVITDAPNLNATASDIEYSSGVSVADELDDLSHKETKTLVSGDMTFPTGYSLFGNYPNNVIVRGNVALVNVSVKMNVSTAGSRYIDNFLPSGYRPSTDVSGVVETGLGDGKMQPVYIKANGQLGIPPVNLNTDTYAIGTVTIPL